MIYQDKLQYRMEKVGQSTLNCQTYADLNIKLENILKNNVLRCITSQCYFLVKPTDTYVDHHLHADRMEFASSRPDHLPTLSTAMTCEHSLLGKSPYW